MEKLMFLISPIYSFYSLASHGVLLLHSYGCRTCTGICMLHWLWQRAGLWLEGASTNKLLQRIPALLQEGFFLCAVSVEEFMTLSLLELHISYGHYRFYSLPLPWMSGTKCNPDYSCQVENGLLQLTACSVQWSNFLQTSLHF